MVAATTIITFRSHLVVFFLPVGFFPDGHVAVFILKSNETEYMVNVQLSFKWTAGYAGAIKKKQYNTIQLNYV